MDIDKAPKIQEITMSLHRDQLLNDGELDRGLGKDPSTKHNLLRAESAMSIDRF